MSSPPITPEQLSALPAELGSLLQAVIDHYEAKIAELEARLGKTPRNSSLPPSSVHPHAKPPQRRPKSKQKRGGQPGHPKHERPLIPPDECAAVESLRPTECRRCGGRLRGSDPAPLRQQVYELPPLQPHVTEYQRHRLRCGCGATTCAELPAGASASQAGPRLTALVAALARQPVVGLDESPTKEANQKAWLWTAVAERFTTFAVRPTREATALPDLLGEEFAGVVNCDRAKMYEQLPRVQWCWAHLKRDFQALVDEASGTAKRLGHDLLRPVRQMFRLWTRYRDGTLKRLGWKRLMSPIRREIDALLLRGAFSGERRLRGMCNPLYDRRERLWTFVEVDGVEPTNNASERALRHAVIWRKLSFGTQSAPGSRFVETILTVVETCRQQGRSAFDYLVSAIQQRRAGRNTPSLLSGV